MSYAIGTFQVQSRKDAEEILADGQDPNRRPLENNTELIRREDGRIAVRLHDTDVVTYLPDGRVILDSGGWKTKTTKDRINRHSPVRLWQEDGQWYVTNRHRRERTEVTSTWTGPDGEDRESSYMRTVTRSYVPFVDGMVIGPQGGLPDKDAILSDTPNVQQDREEIREYAKAFVKALVQGEVPLPGPADCWYCAMETDTGETLGEATGDTGHIRSHMEERYFVPSLLSNAMEEKGYDLQGRNNVYLYWWNLAYTRQEFRSLDLMADTFYRALFTYLLRVLGLPKGGPISVNVNWEEN